jgi:hypothetical protein
MLSWVTGLARWIEGSLGQDAARRGLFVGVPLASGSMPRLQRGGHFVAGLRVWGDPV